MNSSQPKIMIQKLIVYVLLIGISIGFLIPFVWLILSALKSSDEIFVFPPVWLPKHFEWGNFWKALTEVSFGKFGINTIIIAIANTVGSVASCALVGYGFARFRFPGKKILFGLLLATLMIPPEVLLIPQFILFHKLHWINTFLPLTVPSFFGNAFFVFLMRQFFMTIPSELEEAAKIDGAGPLRIFLTIVLPLVKPALTAVAIFSFEGSWNSFLGPLIYLNDQSKYTLQLGLNMFQGTFHTQWNLIMAASVMVMMPIVIIFFFAQRYFIQGITLTGTKG